MGASVEKDAGSAVGEVAVLYLEVSDAYSSYTTTYLFTVSTVSCFYFCLDRPALPLVILQQLTWTQTALHIRQDVLPVLHEVQRLLR